MLGIQDHFSGGRRSTRGRSDRERRHPDSVGVVLTAGDWEHPSPDSSRAHPGMTLAADGWSGLRRGGSLAVRTAPCLTPGIALAACPVLPHTLTRGPVVRLQSPCRVSRNSTRQCPVLTHGGPGPGLTSPRTSLPASRLSRFSTGACPVLAHPLPATSAGEPDLPASGYWEQAGPDSQSPLAGMTLARRTGRRLPSRLLVCYNRTPVSRSTTPRTAGQAGRLPSRLLVSCYSTPVSRSSTHQRPADRPAPRLRTARSVTLLHRTVLFGMQRDTIAQGCAERDSIALVSDNSTPVDPDLSACEHDYRVRLSPDRSYRAVCIRCGRDAGPVDLTGWSVLTGVSRG